MAITKYTEGSLAKTNKANEVIEKVNAFLNMRFELVGEASPPEVEYSDNNVVLRIPENFVPQQREITICENGTATTITVLIPSSE